MDNNDLTRRLLDLKEKISNNKTNTDKLCAKLEVIKEQFQKKGLKELDGVSKKIDELNKKIDELDNQIKKDFEQLEEKYDA